MVCDIVCLSVVSTSRPSCDESVFCGDETYQLMIYDNGIPFGESAFRQIRKVQRRPHPAFAVFQVPSAQNKVPRGIF